MEQNYIWARRLLCMVVAFNNKKSGAYIFSGQTMFEIRAGGYILLKSNQFKITLCLASMFGLRDGKNKGNSLYTPLEFAFFDSNKSSPSTLINISRNLRSLMAMEIFYRGVASKIICNLLGIKILDQKGNDGKDTLYKFNRDYMFFNGFDLSLAHNMYIFLLSQ